MPTECAPAAEAGQRLFLTPGVTVGSWNLSSFYKVSFQNPDQIWPHALCIPFVCLFVSCLPFASFTFFWEESLIITF